MEVNVASLNQRFLSCVCRKGKPREAKPLELPSLPDARCPSGVVGQPEPCAATLAGWCFLVLYIWRGVARRGRASSLGCAVKRQVLPWLLSITRAFKRWLWGWFCPLHLKFVCSEGPTSLTVAPTTVCLKGAQGPTCAPLLASHFDTTLHFSWACNCNSGPFFALLPPNSTLWPNLGHL